MEAEQDRSIGFRKVHYIAWRLEAAGTRVKRTRLRLACPLMGLIRACYQGFGSGVELGIRYLDFGASGRSRKESRFIKTYKAGLEGLICFCSAFVYCFKRPNWAKILCQMQLWIGHIFIH
jgi:hypothetical protein